MNSGNNPTTSDIVKATIFFVILIHILIQFKGYEWGMTAFMAYSAASVTLK